MEINQNKITGGVYLVIDPAMELDLLIPKLQSAIDGGISVIQIWNNWSPETDKLYYIRCIAVLCKPLNIPLFINEDWSLLSQTEDLEGVHFDEIPPNIDEIRKTINRPILTGITCKGNLETVLWAENNEMTYLSFCAMFPSSSAGSCAIVPPDIVLKAKLITDIPFFVSGGITPENTLTLKNQIPFQGVAVISGILSKSNPDHQVKAYAKALI